MRIKPRSFLPDLLKSVKFLTSKLDSSSEIIWSKPLSERNSLKAVEVIAKPPGTFTPNFERLLIISPSDEFFPPTSSKSFKEI